jgi:uncharacterized membrane protein YedE/YeeE
MPDQRQAQPSWRRRVLICLALLCAFAAAAALLRAWLLMAAPIGFLFGFFLQKGDLCGAAACSEILLFKSWSKMAGIWVCIAVSMAGFAVLDALGWVVLAPKPFLWLNMVVGGLLFGSGMVLAGGCVTGSLYKAGTGNLNSMAALAGLPIGVSLVEYGLLSPLHAALSRHILTSGEGGVLTLSALSGLSFQILAGLFAGATLLAAALLAARRKKKRPPGAWHGKSSPGANPFTRSWKPWQAGAAIGLLAVPAYLCAAAAGHNYPLGTTGGVTHAIRLLTDRDIEYLCEAPSTVDQKVSASWPSYDMQDQAATGPAGRKIIVCWLPILCAGLVAGAWFAGSLSGRSRLLPKPPGQVLTAFLGGILIGAGAMLGEGCFYGNIVSGWALMSAGAVLFSLVVVAASLVAAYFYLMGGRPSKGK